VPKVEVTKMAFFTCFGPVFIGLEMGFPAIELIGFFSQNFNNFISCP